MLAWQVRARDVKLLDHHLVAAFPLLLGRAHKDNNREAL